MASWLRDDEVTELTIGTITLQYTTAERVLLDDLMVELKLNILPMRPFHESYVTNTTGMFTIFDLRPNGVLTYNLQVVSEDTSSFITIGMGRTGSSYFTGSTTSSSGIMFVDILSVMSKCI